MTLTPNNASGRRGCWTLRCNKDAWFAQLERAALAWNPPAELRLDVEAVRGTLMEAARRRDPWLLHPCATAITDRLPQPVTAHARLAVWVGANTVDGDLGGLALGTQTWVWGHEGSFTLEPGIHRMSDIALRAGSPGHLPVPDPWGDSFAYRDEFGDLTNDAWWNRAPLSEEGEARLANDIHALLRVEHALATILPETAAWVADVTRVVVPLASPPSATFRSGTLAQLPGVVLVEVTGQPLLTLEALVHESAHLYFHLEETLEPFFVPNHGQLYNSPLRPDPRPLRGIFLAYHALGYMCALYNDWLGATGDERCTQALVDLRVARDEARATLEQAFDGLTDAGQRFLQICEEQEDESGSR